MVFVFDLDDTLYDEMSYVKSGFQAVAAYMAEQYGVSAKEAFEKMSQVLIKKGRGAVFDDVLRFYGFYNKRNVRACVSAYRLHSPQLSLYRDAVEILETLKAHPLYIVTDGNKIVQRKKLQALNLYKQVSFCYVTHSYGRKHAKPSPYCFLKIIQREKVPPKEVVYIADDPHKDFVGIKPLGFQTVRLMRGRHKNMKKPKAFEADRSIDSLLELGRLIPQPL